MAWTVVVARRRVLLAIAVVVRMRGRMRPAQRISELTRERKMQNWQQALLQEQGENGDVGSNVATPEVTPPACTRHHRGVAHCPLTMAVPADRDKLRQRSCHLTKGMAVVTRDSRSRDGTDRKAWRLSFAVNIRG
jgi:hypothetical protein